MNLSERNVDRMEALIESAELTDRVLIVKEMGILVELYRLADWVFVGGGFGKGIHSLLDACGLFDSGGLWPESLL